MFKTKRKVLTLRYEETLRQLRDFETISREINEQDAYRELADYVKTLCENRVRRRGLVFYTVCGTIPIISLILLAALT